MLYSSGWKVWPSLSGKGVGKVQFEAKGKDEGAFNEHRNLDFCLNGIGALFALRINSK